MPASWRCHIVEVSRRGATPSRSRGAALSRSQAVEELWCHAVEEPRRGGRREEQSQCPNVWERERAVAAALNMGEMEMNERE
jgi:hypothetical protein